MYQIGDVIIYSVHGLCQIDDICEKTVSGVTRTYYVMHPLGDDNLVISCPVDSKDVLMLETMDRQEAENILRSFEQPGIDWVDDYRQRSTSFKEIIKSGDRETIAKIANTMLVKNAELQSNRKNLYEADRKMLADIQNILYAELALTLETSVEEIVARIDQMIEERVAALVV